ncbi:MAG: polysaccharide biosynthesis protein [Calditrichaeota bacterium]|nr:polysaccharide biosynthesis protein [Calditrichota bacterium]
MRLRNRHLLLLDLLVFCVCPVLAVALRTDSPASVAAHVHSLAIYALFAIAIRLAVFIPVGLYSRYWRYASVAEIAQVTLAVSLSTLLLWSALLAVLTPLGVIQQGFPRSIPLIDGLLVLPAVGGIRFLARLRHYYQQRRANNRPEAQRVAIVGAGEAGGMIVKEIAANPQLGLHPVAFIDDDSRKHNLVIHGVRVVGGREVLAELRDRYGVQQAIIAMPTAPGKTIRELVQLCRQAGLAVRVVPGVFELLAGKVMVSQLRPVDITDLLRREPVCTDMKSVAALLRGKVVMVTGAGGSIGLELCRQILQCAPAELVALGHGENSVFEACNELRTLLRETRGAAVSLRPVIADIRDRQRMRAVLATYRPVVIFHAAAHKHVPLMEENVQDAVSNNVLGTRNLLELASELGVERFVLISTDKAVNPTSVMGATKRVAEFLVQDAALRTGRPFVAVRFGNVLGSRGSVVPLFKQQIAAGGPVTVTHPEAERYFMTIPEAVQLVLQAAALGSGGEIFVLDMGQPVRVLDLARDLIRLTGLKEGEDIEIVFTGLRPGEKLRERLFLDSEEYARTAHQQIFQVRNGMLKGESPLADLHQLVKKLEAAAASGSEKRVRRLLQRLVPEYTPVPADGALAAAENHG